MSMRTGTFAVSLAFTALINSGCAVNSAQPAALNPHRSGAVMQADDHVIAMTIQQLFSQNDVLAKSNISVESLYGVVLLSGMVKTQLEQITAQTLAETIEGVKAVHNALELQPLTSEDWQPSPPDRQLISSKSAARVVPTNLSSIEINHS